MSAIDDYFAFHDKSSAKLVKSVKRVAATFEANGASAAKLATRLKQAAAPS